MDNASGSLNSNDHELIDNLRKGGSIQKKSEDQLFSTFLYFIETAQRKYKFSEDEAFDAYADTILAAIEQVRKGSFEGRSSIKTWVSHIFHNKCVDLVRKKTTNKQSVHQTTSITDMLFQLSDSGKSIIQRLIDKSEWDFLRTKINELGENCRQLLTLSADGLSDKEIGNLMAYKTAEVVKTSRLRCLEKLKRLYKKP